MNEKKQYIGRDRIKKEAELNRYKTAIQSIENAAKRWHFEHRWKKGNRVIIEAETRAKAREVFVVNFGSLLNYKIICDTST